jgi:hypothetical protein
VHPPVREDVGVLIAHKRWANNAMDCVNPPN